MSLRGPWRFTGSQLLKTSVFLGCSLLVVAVFLFTNATISRLTAEVSTTSRVLAQFCAQASFPAVRDPELQRIFSDVISHIDFPIVITDNEGIPRAWREVGVDPSLVPAESIDSLSTGRAIVPEVLARIEAVRQQVARLDQVNEPILMTTADDADTLGAVHYGDPPVIAQLRWMPYISVGGLLIVVWLGVWGFTSIREAERRNIWVGMAKETAHQLGTPLSSLMGWIELMRGHAEESVASPDVRLPRAEMEETLNEMELDVERLNKVAQRFSHVGSAPSLQLQSVSPVVREAVQYVRRRLPQGGRDIEIRERYEEVPPVNMNRELVEWALENLLTNAVSAIERGPGVIEVRLDRRKETESVEIEITDDGRGMTPAEQRRAFEPGYTTKRRGWGLGLALARRVVQEYHGGRIFISHSAPGKGTTIVISFPT
jgi:Histidine kinase-, DNA gyrase B-, and HSP90-like ATPase